ncbi:MAG: OmpH family outer membrane protein [Alphaproteobacteria bacterium]|nr:OmpH family outer membrane protein [Alphaproteobacteria bacterium]
MRNFKFILLILAFILSTNAKAENTKIGVVDFGLIMNSANVTKAINAQIDAKKNEFLTKDKEAQKIIVKKQQSLVEKKAILPKEVFESEREALEKEIKFAQEKSKENREILNNGIKKSRVFLDGAIRKYIAKIAKDKNIDLVLPKEQVVISSKNLSITKEVLDLVNKDLKEVKINFADSKEK